MPTAAKPSAHSTNVAGSGTGANTNGIPDEVVAVKPGGSTIDATAVL